MRALIRLYDPTSLGVEARRVRAPAIRRDPEHRLEGIAVAGFERRVQLGEQRALAA